MIAFQRLKPLVAPVIHRILGPDHADEEILQEEEIEEVKPPAFLPGMLERVTGTDELGNLAQNVEAARATVVRHAPVIRRVYRSAMVSRNGFATLRTNQRYGKAFDVGKFAGPIVSSPEIRFCQTYVSWRYFGHWLTDSIPSALIDPTRGSAWMPPETSWSHASDYLEVLGLQHLDGPLVLADHLIVYQDFGQGSSKRARYSKIRKKLHSIFGGAPTGDLVYIRRGQTGISREIRNESELTDQLLARNWKVIDISKSNVEDMQRVLCSARVVVSMEGSHLTHAQMSLRRASTLVTIVPHDRFTTAHAGYSNANRINFGMVIASGSQANGYFGDIEEILRTVDLADGNAFS